MKILITAVLASMLAAGPALAQPASTARTEVLRLLDFVERSGCRFERNGAWHASAQARRHLQQKYDYLDKRGLAPDAETFIARAATESSTTGKPYRVQCAGG